MTKPPARELNAAEQERLTEVESLLESSDQKMAALYDSAEKKAEGLEKDAAQKVYKQLRTTDAYKQLAKQLSELREEESELRPRPRRKSGVWLLRRQADVAAAPNSSRDE